MQNTSYSRSQCLLCTQLLPLCAAVEEDEKKDLKMYWVILKLGKIIVSLMNTKIFKHVILYSSPRAHFGVLEAKTKFCSKGINKVLL